MRPHLFSPRAVPSRKCVILLTPLPTRQRHSRRCLAFAGVLGIFAAPAFSAAKLKPHYPATIFVYNFAQVSPASLDTAEREGGRILGEAGLSASCKKCNSNQLAIGELDICIQARQPTDLTLRILTAPLGYGRRDMLLGFAAPPKIANIFYDSAVRFAGRDFAICTRPTSWILETRYHRVLRFDRVTRRLMFRPETTIDVRCASTDAS